MTSHGPFLMLHDDRKDDKAANARKGSQMNKNLKKYIV